MKVCEVCGKGRTSGNNVSHSMRHTKRTFGANIQKVDVPLASLSLSFNKYTIAGTNIIPPPVENRPHIIPAKIPIIAFFNIIKKPTFLPNFIAHNSRFSII